MFEEPKTYVPYAFLTILVVGILVVTGSIQVQAKPNQQREQRIDSPLTASQPTQAALASKKKNDRYPFQFDSIARQEEIPTIPSEFPPPMALRPHTQQNNQRVSKLPLPPESLITIPTLPQHPIGWVTSGPHLLQQGDYIPVSNFFIDSSGIIHVVFAVSGTQTTLYYTHNGDPNGEQGWSEPEQVTVINKWGLPPIIQVKASNDGVVHVMWHYQFDNSDTGRLEDTNVAWYTFHNPGGAWDTPVNILGGPQQEPLPGPNGTCFRGGYVVSPAWWWWVRATKAVEMVVEHNGTPLFLWDRTDSLEPYSSDGYHCDYSDGSPTPPPGYRNQPEVLSQYDLGTTPNVVGDNIAGVKASIDNNDVTYAVVGARANELRVVNSLHGSSWTAVSPVPANPADTQRTLEDFMVDVNGSLHLITSQPIVGQLPPIFYSYQNSSWLATQQLDFIYFLDRENSFHLAADYDGRVYLQGLYYIYVRLTSGTWTYYYNNGTHDFTGLKGNFSVAENGTMIVSTDPRFGLILLATNDVQDNSSEDTVVLSRESWVDATSGNLHASIPLFLTAGTGPQPNVSLVYNSIVKKPEIFQNASGWFLASQRRIISNGYDYSSGGKGYPVLPLTALETNEGEVIYFSPKSRTPDNGVVRFISYSADQLGLSLDVASGIWTLHEQNGTQHTFLANGLIDETRDQNNNVVDYQYDQQARLIKIITTVNTGVGREIDIQYNSDNQMQSLTDPSGQAYTLEYYELGATNGARTQRLLKSITRVRTDGQPNERWQFMYHSRTGGAPCPVGGGTCAKQRAMLESIQDPNGHTTLYYYSFGSVYRSINAVNQRTSISWSSYTSPTNTVCNSQNGFWPVYKTFVTDWRGNKTTFEVDPYWGTITNIMYPPNKQQVAPVIERSYLNYDTYGNPSPLPYLDCQRDPNGNATRRNYNVNPDSNSLVSILNTAVDPPDGPGGIIPPVLYEYLDPQISHLVTRVTDSMGNQTDYQYNDPNNNYLVTKVIEPPTDPTDNPPNTRPETTMTYDTKGRLKTRTDQRNNSTTYNYADAVTGLVTSIDRPGITGNEEFTYNAMGQVVTQKQPAHGSGVVTTYEYDQAHRLKQTILPATTDHGSTTVTNTYDPNGNVKTVTDQLGKLTTYEYDNLDRRTRTTRHDGTFSRTEYDPNGNVTDTYDFNGNQTQFVYDALNRAIKERRFDTVNNQHLKFGYEYDANGNRKKAHELNLDESIHTTTLYDYDQLNRLVTTTYPPTPDHSATTMENRYDDNGNLIRTKDQRGTFTWNCYTKRNLLSATVRNALAEDPACATAAYRSEYTYDANGNRKTMKVLKEDGSDRPATVYEYDALNRLESTTDPLTRPTLTTYDDNGNVLTVTDPSGMVTKTDYDTLNRQRHVISDYGRKNLTTTTKYNAVGNAVSTTDANGLVTTNRYDNLHRLVRTTLPDGSTTRYLYDANGNRTTVTDAKNQTTTYSYDGLNRMITEQDSIGKRTESDYDEFGNLAERRQISGATQVRTTHLYDVLHEPFQTAYPGTTTPTITRTFDEAGNLKTIVDTNTNHAFQYDPLNRMSEDQDILLNRRLVYTNDSLDQRKTMEQWQSGNQERSFGYQYDDAGELKKITNGSDEYAYTYNPDGTRDQLTRPNGTYTKYGYDTAKRLASLNNQKPDTSIISGFGYGYDNVGNRTSMNVMLDSSSNHSLTYGYDTQYRLTSETRTGVSPYTLGWQYDAVGNRLLENRNGTVTTYNYNSANELLRNDSPGPQVVSDDFATPPLTDKWTVRTGLWSETNGELTGSVSLGRALLDLNQPSRADSAISVMVKLNTNLQGIVFHKQSANDYLVAQIRQMTSGGSGDPRKLPTGDATLSDASLSGSQLSSAESTSSVSASSAIGTTPVQAQIQLTRIQNGAPIPLGLENINATTPWTQLSLYVKGNSVNVLVNNTVKLTNNNLPLSSGTMGLALETAGSFDDFSLTDVTTSVGSTDQSGNQSGYGNETMTYDAENRLVHFAQGTMAVDYTYDAFGRRIKKHVNDSGTITEERYYYDGDDVLLDLDGTGNIILRSYVNGLGIDEKLTVDQGGSKAFFLTDALGSTRELIDTGNVVQTRLNYEAFGKTTPVIENLVNRYQFTGREKDAEVPLMYYRARMYDPSTGRFTGRDPERIQGVNTNLYEYVGGSPVTNIDPSGQEIKEISDLYKSSKEIVENYTEKNDPRRLFLETQLRILDKLAKDPHFENNKDAQDWLVRVLKIFMGSLNNALKGNILPERAIGDITDIKLLEGTRGGPWWRKTFEFIKKAPEDFHRVGKNEIFNPQWYIDKAKLTHEEVVGVYLMITHIDQDLRTALDLEGVGKDEDWERIAKIVDESFQEVTRFPKIVQEIGFETLYERETYDPLTKRNTMRDVVKEKHKELKLTDPYMGRKSHLKSQGLIK